MFSLAMSGLAFLFQILASIWWHREVFATVGYVAFLCWNFKCSRYLCLGAWKWHREHSILIQASPLSPLVTAPLTISNPREKDSSAVIHHRTSCNVLSLRIPASTVPSKRKTSWVRASSLVIPESHFTTQSSVFLASTTLMFHFRLWALSLTKLPPPPVA